MPEQVQSRFRREFVTIDRDGGREAGREKGRDGERQQHAHTLRGKFSVSRIACQYGYTEERRNPM